MRWVTTHGRTLQIEERAAGGAPQWREGFEASIKSRAVHELLFDPAGGNPLPSFPALLAARAAVNGGAEAESAFRNPRPLIWVDSTETFYPPAAVALGISPNQLYVLHPRSGDLVWATIECLRCRGVGAVVALMMEKLTRLEVRQMQLAAEKGGGTGLLLRPNLASAGSNIYAAATRWLVAPAPGERTVQRWNIQLLYGHGGHIGQSFILEKHRASGQTNFVRPSPPLVDHPILSATS